MLRPNGLSTEVILWETIPTGSPLSVNLFVGGTRLPISESLYSCSQLAEQMKPKKPPPSERLRSLGGGVSKTLIGGSIFAFLCKNAPILRGILKGPAPQSRSLKAVSFPSFLVRRQESLKKEIISFIKTISLSSQTKTCFSIKNDSKSYQTPP